jgi:hypothetical protein
MHKNNSSVMKRWIAGLSAMFVMALSGLVPETAYAQVAKSRVYCGKYSNGLPATIIDNGRGRKFAIIVWSTTYFSSTDYSAQMRCERVSKNFAQAIEEGSLRYLVSSRLNGYPVICASRANEGVCDRLLFTLNFGVDPSAVLENLNNSNTNRNSEPLDLSAIDPWQNRKVINFIEWSSVLADENNKQLIFTCITVNKIPTTIVRVRNREIPIIIWKSVNLTNSGLTPEEDCQSVSARFENLKQKNALNYITSGLVNDLPAICAVKAENEPCTSEGLLFELGKDTDPQKILKQMFLSNSDIPVDDNGIGKRDGRDSVCMSRSASGNCSGLLISAIEL